MKLKLIKDNEVVLSREEYEEYKTIYYRFKDIVESIKDDLASYEVVESRYFCDVVVSYGFSQMPIKRFDSYDPDYNRMCAEELCELLNQKQ